MNKTRRTQYIILIIAFLLIMLSKPLETLGVWLVVIGLAIVSSVCVWMGIDYYRQEKRYVGVLMIFSAIAIMWIAVRLILG